MLDIALHNPRQHQQFQHGAGPLLLARAAEADSLWLTVDQDRTPTVEALLEIVSDADGIRMQMAGCEKECFCGRPCELQGDCRIELPAQFSIGDTRFEITDMGGGRRRPRPLEVLVADKSKLSESTGRRARTLAGHAVALVRRARHAAPRREQPAGILRAGGPLCRRVDRAGRRDRAAAPRRQLGDRRQPSAASGVGHSLRHARARSTGRHAANDVPRRGCKEPEENADAAQLVEMLESLDMAEATAVVVSPLVNAARDLIGAIYGFRSVRAGNARRGIRYLEAHLIELLANAVSEGIARIEHEAEVDRRRVLMEQALSATRRTPTSQQAAASGEKSRCCLPICADFRASPVALGIEQTYRAAGRRDGLRSRPR